MNIGALEKNALLAIVALHPHGYGISIQDHIRRRTGHEYSIGSLYACLDRLEEKGFVKSRLGEKGTQRGSRRKLYFTVTAPGQAALQEELRATSALRRGLRWVEAFNSIEAIA